MPAPVVAVRESLRRLGKLVRLLRTKAYRRALRRGVAAAIEHESVLAGMDVGCVIDVGAHHGQFAVMAHRLFPQADLLLFEPQAAAFQELAALFDGDTRVRMHQCALGSAQGTATLHQSARSDSSSLLPISPLQVDAFPGTQETGTVDVEVRRLSDIVDPVTLRRPILLKIDVQGYELRVLEGCGEALQRHVDYVYVECSMKEFYAGQPLAGKVIEFLQTRNFRLSCIGNPIVDRGGRLLQADMLFSRTKDSVSDA